MTASLPRTGAAPAQLAREVVERTIEVAGVPAPSGHEHRRAALVSEWWRADGFGPVSIDEVGNCWAGYAAEGPALVLAAHLDTVFDESTVHGVVRDGDRLVGPSVGDDSVALAALGAVGRLVAASDGPMPVFILATVGEEGLGNLAGALFAVAHPPVELDALIAIEGNYLGRVATVGVGSRRWRVEVSGPGGHAWEESQAPSAVHEAARRAHTLALLATEPGTTSLNVGKFSGGEAINARARKATFELEVRGADVAALGRLAAAAEAILAQTPPSTLSVRADDIGRRPAGRIDSSHPLVAASQAALEAHSVSWRETAASTDANAAHAAGLPALALGVTFGAAEHTPQEWVELPPIATGLAVLASTVARYEIAIGGGTMPRGADR